MPGHLFHGWRQHDVLNLIGQTAQVCLAAQWLGRVRVTYSSVQNALGNLGRGGVGPLMTGPLQVMGGYGATFSFTALTYGASSMLYFICFRAIDPPRQPLILPRLSVWVKKAHMRLATLHALIPTAVPEPYPIPGDTAEGTPARDS